MCSFTGFCCFGNDFFLFTVFCQCLWNHSFLGFCCLCLEPFVFNGFCWPIPNHLFLLRFCCFAWKVCHLNGSAVVFRMVFVFKLDLFVC